MTSTAAAVVAILEDLDVEYLFGYPGGRVIELLEYLPDSEVDVVRPRDEREASVMAEVHGRLTGEPAVLAGQGPWIGSLGMMGQMEARLASSPRSEASVSTTIGEEASRASICPIIPRLPIQGPCPASTAGSPVRRPYTSAITLASRSSRGRTTLTSDSGRYSRSSITRPPG